MNLKIIQGSCHMSNDKIKVVGAVPVTRVKRVGWSNVCDKG